ncbi:MAG: DegT/DnrJ/EryC1/StrS family aminotransferase [Anaerolineales bacterium]
MTERIYLSPPHMSGEELRRVQDVFAQNWVAPAGPHLAQFETLFQEYTGAANAVALSSGTAALHLALIALGVEAGDEVLVSTLTFAGSVYPIRYQGARPVFIDSAPDSWNMDPNLLEDALKRKTRQGPRPKAVIPVHLYGQAADMDAILDICARYDVPVIEDAAESLGSRYKDRHPGTLGQIGIFSFNGNKIITAGGGGMLITKDPAIAAQARKLAGQAREPVPHYEHTDIGYNYRMSNVLAAIGCGQMAVLDDRVARKRAIFAHYRVALGDIPGLHFVDEMPYGLHTRWLSVMLVDAAQFGATPEQIRLRLEDHNIEARSVWKPMHLQPVFKGYETVGGAVAEGLFERGLCLPSGTALTDAQLDHIIAIIREMHGV